MVTDILPAYISRISAGLFNLRKLKALSFPKTAFGSIEFVTTMLIPWMREMEPNLFLYSVDFDNESEFSVYAVSNETRGDIVMRTSGDLFIIDQTGRAILDKEIKSPYDEPAFFTMYIKQTRYRRLMEYNPEDQNKATQFYRSAYDGIYALYLTYTIAHTQMT